MVRIANPRAEYRNRANQLNSNGFGEIAGMMDGAVIDVDGMDQHTGMANSWAPRKVHDCQPNDVR